MVAGASLPVSEVIRKSQADVIGLQEAVMFQVQDLVSAGGSDWVGAVVTTDGKQAKRRTPFSVRRTADAASNRKRHCGCQKNATAGVQAGTRC